MLATLSYAIKLEEAKRFTNFLDVCDPNLITSNYTRSKIIECYIRTLNFRDNYSFELERELNNNELSFVLLEFSNSVVYFNGVITSEVLKDKFLEFQQILKKEQQIMENLKKINEEEQNEIDNALGRETILGIENQIKFLNSKEEQKENNPLKDVISSIGEEKTSIFDLIKLVMNKNGDLTKEDLEKITFTVSNLKTNNPLEDIIVEKIINNVQTKLTVLDAKEQEELKENCPECECDGEDCQDECCTCFCHDNEYDTEELEEDNMLDGDEESYECLCEDEMAKFEPTDFSSIVEKKVVEDYKKGQFSRNIEDIRQSLEIVSDKCNLMLGNLWSIEESRPLAENSIVEILRQMSHISSYYNR